VVAGMGTEVAMGMWMEEVEVELEKAGPKS
jgi:hypothetical protein